MRRALASVAVAAFACAANGQESPFVRAGSIGEVTKAQEVGSIKTLELNEWVGEKFIFLQERRALRSFGYQLFEPRLPYDKWVGRTLTVTGVSETHSGLHLLKIVFRADDGSVVSAVAYADTVQGIAPLRDLEYARSRWFGKTLWIRQSILATWNETTQESGAFIVKKYSPVEVTDVVAGSEETGLVRLVLKTVDDRTGYRDVSVSGTNVAPSLRKYGHFDEAFFETDPRIVYQWAAEVWRAVESGQVFVGMTTEQARMSWGKPKEVNSTTTARGTEEQWVYGSGNYLYVSHDKVTAIQH